jgi:glycosyltransferase involved in cell wall biosynthesis
VRSVCIVIAQFEGGGAERTAATLAADLSDSGWKVSVITLGRAMPDDYVLPSTVSRLALDQLRGSSNAAAGLIANVRRVLALRRAIRDIQPQTVLAMMTTTAILTILATRGFACRVVVSERVYPPFSTTSRVWQFLRIASYRCADLVVAQTEAAAEWLREHCGVSRVAVVHNAVALPNDCITDPSSGFDTATRGTANMLLAVGRLEHQKGFDILLEAFARISKQFPDWTLCLLGEGPARPRLLDHIREQGLEARVRLVGRVRDVRMWYEQCDVFCLSSRYEGFPNALLEAMSAGRAVVSFDCLTGPREIITNRVNGLLVEPADGATGLAAALAELMSDSALRQELGQRALQVNERFSRATLLRVWQRALAPESGTP